MNEKMKKEMTSEQHAAANRFFSALCDLADASTLPPPVVIGIIGFYLRKLGEQNATASNVPLHEVQGGIIELVMSGMGIETVVDKSGLEDDDATPLH